MKPTITTLILLAAASSAMAGTAIQSNGGFELGAGADSGDWEEFAFGAPGAVSERFFGNAASGSYSHHIMAVGNASTGSAAGLTQNTASFGLGTLAGGSTLRLSFDAQTNFGPGGVGFYALRVLNRDGAIVANTGLMNFGGGVGYQSYSTGELLVPALGGLPNDYYSAFVEIVVNAGAFEGSFADASIDNVVITGTVVPTPGALAILGVGGLAAVRRRR